MSQFRIDLSYFDNGWVTADISAGEQSYTAFVSYLSDGLLDMADATLTLLRHPLTERATFSWQDELGQDRWILRRISTDRVAVRILSFPDTFSRWADERGEIVIEAECTTVRLLGQVKGLLHMLLNKYGEEGYLLRWSHPFPMSHFRQLEVVQAEAKKSSRST